MDGTFARVQRLKRLSRRNRGKAVTDFFDVSKSRSTHMKRRSGAKPSDCTSPESGGLRHPDRRKRGCHVARCLKHLELNVIGRWHFRRFGIYRQFRVFCRSNFPPDTRVFGVRKVQTSIVAVSTRFQSTTSAELSRARRLRSQGLGFLNRTCCVVAKACCRFCCSVDETIRKL